MTLKTHFLHPPEAELRAALKGALGDTISISQGPEVTDGVEVLVGGRPQEDQLDIRSLKALVVPYAGLPVKTREMLLSRPGLPVYNLHHNAEAVAEMALALLLAAAKMIVPMDRALRNFDWRPRFNPDPGIQLAGCTALILGFGAIGRRVAALTRGIGMDVETVRRSNISTLDALLPDARAVLVCLPHTPETEGLLSRERLALLPPGAVIVNVARAAIIDEDALFEGLESGQLHSAGLDVWYQYPKGAEARTETAPATRPFWTLNNVVMSPHRAGHGPEVERRRALAMVEVLGALAEGRAPPHKIDPVRGY